MNNLNNNDDKKVWTITEIVFDVEGQLSSEEHKKLQQEYIGKAYEASNKEDIADLASDESGWCVKSFDVNSHNASENVDDK